MVTNVRARANATPSPHAAPASALASSAASPLSVTATAKPAITSPIAIHVARDVISPYSHCAKSADQMGTVATPSRTVATGAIAMPMGNSVVLTTWHTITTIAAPVPSIAKSDCLLRLVSAQAKMKISPRPRPLHPIIWNVDIPEMRMRSASGVNTSAPAKARPTPKEEDFCKTPNPKALVHRKMCASR